MATGVGREVTQVGPASQSVNVDLKSMSSGSWISSMFAEYCRIGDVEHEKLQNVPEQRIDPQYDFHIPHEGLHGFEREDSFADSDIESNISSTRVRVIAGVASQAIVHGLPVVPSIIASFVHSTPTLVVDVDWVARAKYMRDWITGSRQLCLELLAAAMLALHRSPRLAARSTQCDIYFCNLTI